MSIWSFYDLSTGALAGLTFCGPEAYLQQNTPAGHGAIEGSHDAMSKRVSLDTGEVVDWQPAPPADTAEVTYAWDQHAARWVAVPTMAKRAADAHAQIDAAAGAARLRYITDVAGQQAVYLLKLEEARAYLASLSASDAPHVVSEAAATGASPLEVASAIVARADLWNSQLSPAIEGARLGGKAAVSAAADADALAAALATALAALAAI